MKIAAFGHKHINTREGGIEVVVTELYKRLGLKHNITIYDRYELDNPPDYSDMPDVPYKIKKSPTLKNGKLNAVLASLASTLQCACGNYDLVHVHAEGPCAFLFLLKRKPIVVTVHGIDWKRAKWGHFASQFIHHGEKMLVKYADEIIVLTQDLHDYFLKEYARETTIIGNGVTVTRDENTDELEKLGLNPGEYFLYTGRIVPEKKVEMLINAYLTSGRKEKLVIAGAIPEKPNDIIEFARKEPNVIFTDYVTGATLRQLYTHAKLCILPSILEGQSLSLLEGLSYGIPYVISDIPENVQTANEYGYLFESANLKSLTETINDESLAASHDPAAQIAYIKGKHDWDVVAEKTEEVYRDAIRKKRG